MTIELESLGCKHPKLVLLEGPIHANDNPPIYQCQACKDMLRVTVTPDVIGVSFGKPSARTES